MKRIVYLLVFLTAGMFFFTAGAQYNWVGINGHEHAPADVKLVQSDIEHTQIQFSLDGYKETPLETPRGTQMVITVGEGVRIMEKGKPDLAKLFTTIIIPDMDEMEVSVTGYEYREFTGIEVAPSKGHFDRSINPDDVPFTYGEVYETDAFWPGELAQLEEPFIMRDFRGQTVTIFPFHYNPVTNTLRVYTDIEVEVTSTGRMGEDPLIRRHDEIVVEPEFGRIYERFFLNMEAAERSYPMLEGEEGSLLIICYDDFMDAMKPFVDWKRTIGRKTEIVPRSEAGNTWQQIKNYVKDYYEQNENLTHLLLIGDAQAQIPVAIGYYGGQSDNMYGFLEGTNSFNDIFVGRFSAETVAHVETQVQRMIEYERDIDETDTWVSTGLGIARNEGAGMGHHGESDIQHMNFIKDTLLNFTYDEVHSCYDGTGYSTSAAIISGHINDGVSAINFCNHGSVTGWSVANYSMFHVNNHLTNVGRLPYITSVACVNGAFVNQTCFAEAWLRATHDGEPTGAIGMMAATINQPWQPPMCGQDEMVSILTEESIVHGSTVKRTYGGVSANGSMFMIPQYGGTGINTHETWILFGDPTLMVRTDVPTPFEAEYPTELWIGDESFTVTNVDDGATAALTMINEEGEVEIVGTDIAENNTAEITFDPLEEIGMMTLAITGFNKVTYINDEIEITHGTFTLTFEVEDQNGNPVADAVVTLDNVEYDPGEYVIEEIFVGEYIYSVAKEGYKTVVGDVEIIDEDVTVEIVLEEGETDTYTVIFKVTDEEGNAILGAIINFDEKDYPTDANGNVWIPNVEEGIYEYTVTKEDYLTVEELIGINKNVNIDVIMKLESFLVTFDVIDEGGDPVADAVITFDYVEYEPGEYVIEDVEAGEHPYSVAKDSYITAFGVVEVIDEDISEEVILTEGSDDPCSVTFNVIDEGNAGIAGAIVTFDGEDHTTDSNGQVVIEEVEVGYYSYSVTKEGYYPIEDMITVDGDITKDVTLYPETHAYTVTFEITDEEGDEIENAVITFDGKSYEPGKYVLEDIEEGTYEYKVEKDGFFSVEDVVNVTDDITVEITMTAAYVATFEITGDDGSTITNAVITFDGIEYDPGHYVFEDLEAGTYDYKVEKDGYFDVEDQVEVEEDVTVDVNMIAAYIVTFEVESKDGSEITDAVITFDDMVNDPGDYVFEDIKTGTYQYKVERDGFFNVEDEMTVDENVFVKVVMDIDTYVFTPDDTELSVFPNPARDKFYVKSSETIKQIRLIDISGQVILKISVDALRSEINVSNLNTGIYFMQIHTTESVVTKRVQVTR